MTVSFLSFCPIRNPRWLAKGQKDEKDKAISFSGLLHFGAAFFSAQAGKRFNMIGAKDQAAYNKDLLRVSLEQVKATDFCDEYEVFDPTVFKRAAEIPLGPSSAAYVLTEFIQRIAFEGLDSENARTRLNDVTACMFKLAQVVLTIHKNHLEQE